jgi:hypothetical protein
VLATFINHIDVIAGNRFVWRQMRNADRIFQPDFATFGGANPIPISDFPFFKDFRNRMDLSWTFGRPTVNL